MRVQKMLKFGTVLVSAIALVGTIHWGKFFSVIQFHKIYVLEWITLAFFTMVWLGGNVRPFLNRIYQLHWFVLFFMWGMVLFVFDIIQIISGIDEYFSIIRVLQHGLIFVYPLVWVSMGVWICHISKKGSDYFIWGAFLLNCIAPILIFDTPRNAMVGTLMIIPYVYFLFELITRPNSFSSVRFGRAAVCFFTAILGFFSFIPFWNMWVTSIGNRTSLLLLICMLFAIPAVLAFKTKRGYKAASVIMVVNLIIFCSGGAVLVNARQYFGLDSLSAVNHLIRQSEVEAKAEPKDKLTIVGKVKKRVQLKWAKILKKVSRKDAAAERNTFGGSLMAPLKHGDYAAGSPRSEFFKVFGNFRVHTWSFTIQDWLQKPIVGIGFIPEVPSYVIPTEKNDGTFHAIIDYNPKPISGPHNTFLTVLARTGLIGSLIFFFLMIFVMRAIIQFMAREKLSIKMLLLIFIVINSFIWAFFQICFEAPYCAAILWFFVGILIERSSLTRTT